VSQRSVHIMTFGCQMNEHDSLKIASLLEAEGYCLVEDPERADCVILNTCSVREKPQHKVYSALGRLRRLKAKRPYLVIGVGGCVAQQEGSRLLERVPYLDFVFGTHHIHQVPEMVRWAQEGRKRSCEISFESDVRSLHHCPRPLKDEVRAYITIMQGCNNFCSFCVVPYVRGREQSRPPGEILAEAEALAARGVREVILLGQNVNSYGRDLPGSPSFPELLGLLNRVDGIHRIRFTTSHPKDLSVELMDALATLDKVCEHLHLPVQSGSSKVLAAMNRGYTREEYLAKVESLRDRVPGIALTTDVIVGFPGELEEDLQQTLSLLEAVRFDAIYSFKYSPRPMTRAFGLPGDPPEEVKGERLARVQRLQEEITRSILRGCVGSAEEILVEGPSVQWRGQLTGRTRTNRIVHAPGDGASLRGKLLEVKIEESLKHSLLGRIVEKGGAG
jgi:tRNA-2-methylthio-N6-dimethylallyladenosine synthase